ncbi:hypothetical protein [Mycobacterium basiliense]
MVDHRPALGIGLEDPVLAQTSRSVVVWLVKQRVIFAQVVIGY